MVDLGMDLTGGMERKGNVYPYAKSVGMRNARVPLRRTAA